jgi:hypothetical protein
MATQLVSTIAAGAMAFQYVEDGGVERSRIPRVPPTCCTQGDARGGRITDTGIERDRSEVTNDRRRALRHVRTEVIRQTGLRVPQDFDDRSSFGRRETGVLGTSLFARQDLPHALIHCRPRGVR